MQEGKNGGLGTCWYSHKANMAMQLKGLTYDVLPVPLDPKPAWLYDINPAGTVPVLVLVDGTPIPDSEAILRYIDHLQPESSLLIGAPVRREIGANLSSAFSAFMKKEAPPSAAQTLVNGLLQINDHLDYTGTSYLASEQLTAIDCALLPVLYHIQAAGTLRQFMIPTSLVSLHRYMARGFASAAFQQTAYSQESVRADWTKGM